MKNPLTKQYLVVVIFALVGAATSRGDFTDYYSFPANNYLYMVQGSGASTHPANKWSIVSDLTWYASGGIGSPYVSASASQLFLDSGDIFGQPGHPSSYTNLQTLIAAPAAGLWSFDFTLSLSTTTNGSSSGYYSINGTKFSLSAGTGTVSNISLNAGDTFGFGVFGEQFTTGITGGRASLSVRNFSAPVPEPQTFALLLFGLAAVGVFCWRAQRISLSDAANRWPLRVPAFDDFHIQPAAIRALASGR